MAVRYELPVALRELAHSVTASAAYVQAIEEAARRGVADDRNGRPSDLEVADLLEQVARELRRASTSLVHIYGAYTDAACNLAAAAICRRPGGIANTSIKQLAESNAPDRQPS